ncbi:MAG: transposase [Acidobacteriaceae bacterium]
MPSRHKTAVVILSLQEHGVAGPFFRRTGCANYFLRLLIEHRARQRFEVYAFVLMPDHVHLLLTPPPDQSLERAMQFVKGRFSFEAKRQLGWKLEVWQQSYYEVQILDLRQFRTRVNYIEMNPVKAGRCEAVDEFPWSSARRESEVDSIPEWLLLRG